MRVWVIGAGGLLGSAIARRAHAAGHDVVPCRNVPWRNPDAARVQLHSELSSLLSSVRSEQARWAIVWAAGRVTTASSTDEADAEFDLFEGFIGDLRDALTAESSLPSGVFLLTSSAGGVYAGSSHPPFTAGTPALPLAAYGRLKLAQEQVAASGLADHCPVVIARFANVYGPGQDLSKLQGLISRLALSAITREPVTMFVPLDTLRDYVYVDDAATAAVHWLDVAHQGAQVRVVASGEPVSLGYLVGMMQDIAHTRIPIAYGLHESSLAQARDMRLAPDADPFLETAPITGLPAGMRAVYLDILQRHQRASAKTV